MECDSHILHTKTHLILIHFAHLVNQVSKYLLCLSWAQLLQGVDNRLVNKLDMLVREIVREISSQNTMWEVLL